MPADGSTPADDSWSPFEIRNVRETFIEKDEVVHLIHSLENAHRDLIESERAIEKFTFIVDSYQEQPHLLDPHLEELLNLIISIAQRSTCEKGHREMLFTCFYLLTKMRGYKVIIRWLPHEVADVETVLELLTNNSSSSQWQVAYSLLLWLSMVCMIPFDLVRLDNTYGGGDNRAPVMDRILTTAKSYVGSTDKTSDAAAYVLAKFLTRPDVRAAKMTETINWALETLRKATEEGTVASSFITKGVLMMLAQLYKLGKREDLMPFAQLIMNVVTQETRINESSNTLIKKYGVKLIQRIGLIFLKARVAAWRYNRGSRSLAANLASGPVCKIQAQKMEEDEDEEYDIPEETEDVVEQLLSSLKDKDTVVRWSAAKGIGRVTGRLPKELADDIIGSLLELFSFHETDAAWHGGCLALAELGRRGLILPQRLPEVIPIITKSLIYDEKKGNISVGSHVRDAACYVCWSFARAYDPNDIKEYAPRIASALIVVAVFDKEVNVRRAASAAFQENVGRQGTFPHGIDILTTCDYFAVGNRTYSYTELSKFVAGFPEYTTTLIEHLVEFKINHWSVDIRQLASKALYSLTSIAPEYASRSVLPRLVSMATGTDLNTRHGSILALGQICLSLSKVNHPIDGTIVDELMNIELKLRSRKHLLGIGGEYMKKALCSMISDLGQVTKPNSAEKIFCKNSETIDCWHALIDEALVHIDDELQAAAVSALPNLLSLYVDAGQVSNDVKEKILSNYVTQLQSSTQEKTRMGMSLALGSMPKPLISGKLNQILGVLMKYSKLSQTNMEWAESRRDCIRAIERICCTVGVIPDGSVNECICRGNLAEIYQNFIECLEDYSTDSRGDIGAWVREASMSAIQMLTCQVVTVQPAMLPPELVQKFYPIISQQACEKIDRVRALAGNVFSSLLYLEPAINDIPEKKALEEIFRKDKVSSINFAAPGVTFPLFSQLLSLESYRFHVLLGFVISVGGLTESLVKQSHSALMDYLQSDDLNKTRLRQISHTMTKIFSLYQKTDRVTMPLMKTCEQMLTSSLYDSLKSEESFTFPADLFAALKAEIHRSLDPQKLMIAADLLCSLLMFKGALREKCLFQLAVFLCHKFPIVRKTTAKKLFECTIMFDDLVDEDNLDEVMTLLSDTEWDESIEKVKPVRNNLCDLLHIRQPVLVKYLGIVLGDSRSIGDSRLPRFLVNALMLLPISAEMLDRTKLTQK